MKSVELLEMCVCELLQVIHTNKKVMGVASISFEVTVDCQRGWDFEIFAVEAGYRGPFGYIVIGFLRCLGADFKFTRQVTRKLQETDKVASL